MPKTNSFNLDKTLDTETTGVLIHIFYSLFERDKIKTSRSAGSDDSAVHEYIYICLATIDRYVSSIWCNIIFNNYFALKCVLILFMLFKYIFKYWKTRIN